MPENDNSAYLCVPIISPDPYFKFIFGLYLITIWNILIRLEGLYSRSTRSAAYKNDNFACHLFSNNFLPWSIFLLQYWPYLSDHLTYFNDTL